MAFWDYGVYLCFQHSNLCVGLSLMKYQIIGGFKQENMMIQYSHFIRKLVKASEVWNIHVNYNFNAPPYVYMKS